MQRYDLRHLKADFYGRMEEILNEMTPGEIGIFMFEVGDFSPVHESAKRVNALGCELMNSLKYNEVDWTIVVKKRLGYEAFIRSFRCWSKFVWTRQNFSPCCFFGY